MSSCAACVGAAGAACVNLTSCSTAGWINPGRRLPKHSAGFSYSCWIARTISSGAGSLAVKPHPMPHSTHLSNISVPCRVEWRPSRGLVTVLLVLGLAAALAVLASEMPRVAAWPLALIALAYGTWRAWHEARQAVLHIVILPDEGACKVDGAPVDAMSVRWRGPIACLHWRGGDGCRQRCVFWPDTLPAMQRRELRLAAPAPLTARVPTSMAP